jgi:hypothetical protein
LEKNRPKRPPLVSETSTLRERSAGTWVIEKLLSVVHPSDPRRSEASKKVRGRFTGG